MPPIQRNDDPWRQIDLARHLTRLAGGDPDRVTVRPVSKSKNCAVLAWQEHYTLAGAVLEVLDGDP